MGIREAIKNINLTHGESYFNAVTRDDWELAVPKKIGESSSMRQKKMEKRLSVERGALRCLRTSERALLLAPGSRDPKPLSADILSARKYNRPSEKLTGRSRRYFFNPGLSSAGLSTSARPYSFSFARRRRRRRNGHPLRRICIYIAATRKDHRGTFIRAIPARATRSSGQTEI